MTNRNKIAALTILVGAYLIWRQTPQGQTATVSTSEGFDLSEYGGPVTYPQPIKDFGLAIAKAEGFFVPGSVPQRANNPMDVKKPGYPTLAGTTISYFDSVDSGWDAGYYQLYLILIGQSSYYNLDMTLAEMGDVWSPGTGATWAGNVADNLSVPVSTPLYSVLG